MALRAFGTAALLLATAACGNDDLTTTDRPSPHPRPSTSGYCVDLPAVGGDPGYVLGTDWSGEDHDYGDTVVVLACASPDGRGTLALTTDGTGITITPAQVRLQDHPDGMAEFEVTVDRGAHGRLRVVEQRSGSGGDLSGPTVVTDDDGWHLERTRD